MENMRETAIINRWAQYLDDEIDVGQMGQAVAEAAAEIEALRAALDLFLPGDAALIGDTLETADPDHDGEFFEDADVLHVISELIDRRASSGREGS